MKWCLTWVFLVGAAASGCALGGSHAYHATVPVLQRADHGAQVALAVHDQRHEVLTGDKDPDFVGLLRGGYGNPFDVTTESHAPLASDMARSVQSGLEQAGYRVTLVPVPHTMKPEQAIAAMAATGAPRLLLLRFAKWKSDTMYGTGLIYDIEALAMDARGVVLGEAHQSGRDDLGGAFNGKKHARKAVPAAFQQKLEQLVDDPRIRDALTQPHAVEARAGAARSAVAPAARGRSR